MHQYHGLGNDELSRHDLPMRLIATASFIFAGLVNLLPATGVLGAERLQALYGIAFSGTDLLVLMRHRAVLFGIVGVLLLAAAFRPPLRFAASMAGLASMLSFVLLSLSLSNIGPELKRVFWADVVASVVLAVGLWSSWRERNEVTANHSPERSREK